MKIISYVNIIRFHKNILRKVGLDKASLEAVTNGLCEASLRGVDSHGIRLLSHYVKSAQLGRKNPNPTYSFETKFPAVGVLDADNAFGLAAGMKAIDYGVNMADNYGIAAIIVKNSSHPGAMASIALKAAKMKYIAFAFTHADSLLLSFNGKRPYFGTNPICFAAPRHGQEPYCLDMATSMISWNKLLNFQTNKVSLKENFAADCEGKMTKNYKKVVSLFPAGLHKGYGLASMVEILCGVFTGMSYGRSIPKMYSSSLKKPRHLGQFYILMRADGCLDLNFFLKRMKNFSEEVRREPAQRGKKVKLPNDPEIEISKKRMANGIPIDKKTFIDLQKLSEEFSVPLRVK